MSFIECKINKPGKKAGKKPGKKPAKTKDDNQTLSISIYDNSARDGRNSQLRVSLNPPTMKAAGWKIGDHVKLLIGDGADEGKAQLIKSDDTDAYTLFGTHIGNVNFAKPDVLKANKHEQVKVQHIAKKGIIVFRLPHSFYAGQTEKMSKKAPQDDIDDMFASLETEPE